MKKWRFFELKNNEYYTLFHAVNGSRKIPVGQWITAKQSLVKEGRDQKLYRGGFHAFDEFETIEKFIKKFRMPRTIVAVEVEVGGKLRKKPTNDRVLLAPKMMIPIEHQAIIVKE